MKKTALLPLCCVILLTACTGFPKTQIKVIRPEVPASLRTCESAPAYPGDSITQKDMAKWITRLWYAHADCESKLASLNQALGYGDEHTESKR